MNYLGHLRYWNAAYFCSCIMKCAKKNTLPKMTYCIYFYALWYRCNASPSHTPQPTKMYFKVEENCMCKKCIASFEASFCWPLLIAMHWMQLLLRRFHKSSEKERGYSNPPQPPLVDVVYNVHCFFCLFLSFFHATLHLSLSPLIYFVLIIVSSPSSPDGFIYNILCIVL